jgi:hypothetical protein
MSFHAQSDGRPHASSSTNLTLHSRHMQHYGLHLYSSSTTSLISYIDSLILDYLSLVTLCFLVITCYLDRPNGNPPYLGLVLKPNTVVLPILWSMNHGGYARPPWFTIYDNVSDIYLLGNLVQHQRTKHIEMNIFILFANLNISNNKK